MFKADVGDLEKELSKIADADVIIPEILAAAAPIVEEKMKETVRNKANKGYATGELVKSIKAKKPAKNKYGHYVAITPTGKDKKGVRNAEKLAYMEYGTSKQAAAPSLQETVKKSEDACLKKMQEKFDEETR